MKHCSSFWILTYNLHQGTEDFCCSCVKETLHICYVVIQTLFYHLESLKLGLVYLSKVCETNPLLFYVHGFHFKQFALTSSSPR